MMEEAIDREVSNLSTCKLWDIVRLSAIVRTEPGFLAEVRREIERRDCTSEAHRLRRYLFSSSVVDDSGREIPITEEMIYSACQRAGYQFFPAWSSRWDY